MDKINKLEIAKKVSEELKNEGIKVDADVIEYIDMFIVNELRSSIQSNKSVYIPFFGRLQPNKKHIKKLKSLGVYSDRKDKKKIGIRHVKKKKNKIALATLDFKIRKT
jgi:nucleoid DNA-binding protein